MLWETKGSRRNTFCLHAHMFIILNFHFSERVWAGSCRHHKREIFLPDFAAVKAKRGGERTSAGAAARALPAAASGHRRAEEEMPGGAGRSPLSLIAAERARERKLPQTRFAGVGGPGGAGQWKGCGEGTGWTRSPGRCRRRVLPIAPAAPVVYRGEQGVSGLRICEGRPGDATALQPWCVY